jgi:hypothetical protein
MRRAGSAGDELAVLALVLLSLRCSSFEVELTVKSTEKGDGCVVFPDVVLLADVENRPERTSEIIRDTWRKAPAILPIFYFLMI